MSKTLLLFSSGNQFNLSLSLSLSHVSPFFSPPTICDLSGEGTWFLRLNIGDGAFTLGFCIRFAWPMCLMSCPNLLPFTVGTQIQCNPPSHAD